MSLARRAEQLRAAKPLADAKTTEWRTYVKELEALLDEVLPTFTGLTLFGVPVIADPAMPKGRFEFRRDGEVVAVGEYEGKLIETNTAALQVILQALMLVRHKHLYDPDELAVAPEPEEEEGAYTKMSPEILRAAREQLKANAEYTAKLFGSEEA